MRLSGRFPSESNSTLARIARGWRAFYGWRLLFLMYGPRAAGSAAIGVGSSLFVLPLEQSLGMTRGLVSLLFSAAGFLFNASAPLSGMLIDRLGPRKVLLGSSLMMALGFLLFARSNTVAMVFAVYLGLIALSAPNVAWNASNAMINNWFDRYKGMAMGLLGVGSALGGVVLVPVLALAIETWDWRIAAVLMAAMILGLGIPAVVLSRNNPEEMGQRPDGAAVEAASAPVSGEAPQLPGFAAKEAFRTRAYWMLAGAVFCFSAAIMTINIHMVPILVWKGMDEVASGLMISLRSLIGIPVVVVGGLVGDRLGRLSVASVLAALMGGGVLTMLLGVQSWLLVLAVVLLSASQGLYPLSWAALGGVFGRRSYNTIRGSVMGLTAVGTTVFPALVGYLYDWTGGYTAALGMVLALSLLSATFMVLAPRHPRHHDAGQST